MKNLFRSVASLGLVATSLFAQNFEVKLNWGTQEPPIAYKVVVPNSPAKMQNIFIGGVDSVATWPTYGNPAGFAPAKQWHDFIGFVPADASKGETDFMGYLVVNHEMVEKNDKIGDGGGMTAFKIRKNNQGAFEVVNNQLPDGRTAKFWNVDFVNTVGSTVANCGGIYTDKGRVWTAEEWVRSANVDGTGDDLFQKGNGVRDTSDFVIGTSTPAGFPGFNGQKIKAFENTNWMVEVDVRTGKAVRKQYNWGRQGFEAGVVMPDNKTVFLTEDGNAQSSLFTKFVADVAGDFTKGKTYLYKQNAGSFAGTWVEVDNTNLQKMINIHDEATKLGITGFSRLEWITYDKVGGKLYMTETGVDRPATANANYIKQGWTTPKHAFDRSQAQGCGDSGVTSSKYWDYYGRVLVFDPTTNEVKTYLEAGPFYAGTGAYQEYPSKHLSNPDGIGVLYVNNKRYLMIQEDLNGTSFGRVPVGVNNRTCEMFLLDLEKEPTINNLIKISTVAYGAEVTGCAPTPDGKAIFINSQHPSSWNEYPYNNSLTYVIDNIDQLLKTSSVDSDNDPKGLVNNGEGGFGVYPNPVSRTLNLSKSMDAAVYDASGNRIKVVRDANQIDVSDLSKGVYYIMNTEKKLVKVVVE
jgi:hypothetical protein